MKKSKDLFKCEYCGKMSDYSKLENELKKGLICKDCFVPEVKAIMKKMEVFCNSTEFFNLNSLIIRKLWLSEQMGNWHDMNTPRVQYQESVTDYLDLSIEKLQKFILIELSTIFHHHPELEEKWVNEKLKLYESD